MNRRWTWGLLCVALGGCAQITDEEATALDTGPMGGASNPTGPSPASGGSRTVAPPTGGRDGGLVGGETGGASPGTGGSDSTGGSGSGGSATGGATSSGGTTSSGGNASGGAASSGGSSSSADPGTCLAGWETAPEGAACLDAAQSDWLDGCTNALNCWQQNDCTPSECSSSPDDTCGQNTVSNFNAGKQYADQVYAALCN